MTLQIPSKSSLASILIGKNKTLCILRTGLGIVFIANCLMPLLASDDYTNIVHSSFLAKILPVDIQTLGMFTGINDALVAALLFIGLGLRYVSGYASAWIIGVMMVFGPTHYLDVLEHVGFLSIAIFLTLFNAKQFFNNKPDHVISK